MNRAKIMGQMREAVGLVMLIVGGIIGFFVVIALIGMGWSAIYSGTAVEYEGTVQAVTRSNFLVPHTRVVLRTYSEDDVHFTLGGYHDFKIGAQYRVTMVMKPYVFGINCWGKLRGEGIQEVDG